LQRKRIKTLIVDDSLIFRETLARGISRDPAIKVVATASDAFMARDMIIKYDPDVMTLDVEMPGMDGIEFLRRLMPQYPLPVVMISALSDRVFDALNAGAVDFVAKPDMNLNQSLDSFIKELIVKIKIASVARLGRWKKVYRSPQLATKTSKASKNWIIAIGASTGGPEAIYQIVKHFDRNTPATVVVQHMPAGFTKMYAQRLNDTCLAEVREAQNGDRLGPGQVLIAPGEYHMRLKRQGGDYMVECQPGEKVNGHCPSVDVLFDSVAKTAGDLALGIILTGMGSDGARGLLAMRRQGARTIGQDESSSVVYGMPRAAYELGAVEKQYSLNYIAQAIHSLLD
jgi:two-component system chemotaxis response regulator CheB